MNEQKKTKGAKWFGIPNLVPYMRPYGKLIFWMVLMAFYGSAMDAVIPLFQQYAIDHYIADSTLAGLGWFIGAYVVVILTQTASNYISAFGACKLELSVGRDLKRESFNHLQTLSFSYFNQNSVGYVHARVMSDTDRIASTLAWSMAEGVMLIGTLTVFMNYAQGMMEPIQWLVQALSSLVNVQVNVERFTTLMETKSDVQDTPEVVEKYGDTFSPKKENWEELHGDIEFKDVTFRYPDGDENILEHFNLKVPQGTNVAIVGETGAGKSTLVNLVCRFYEPTEGQVLIDGRDARERSQLWLHSNIGYVLQTPHLFSGTVLENLRYGRENATMGEIEAAVRAVSAEGIIERLPDGYQSDVGEGGNSLSTGEKQLLSFARALLADPRIFVLDEATSSVDTVTERLIQDAIEKVMDGRTSFVIAHRLSTIRRADVILVVNAGKIVERGSHAELMAKKGVYYGLYTRQYREEQIQASMENE